MKVSFLALCLAADEHVGRAVEHVVHIISVKLDAAWTYRDK